MLKPTAALAPRALLPADPGVALALAQELLDGPKMFHHALGLWGYSGPAADGRPLTVQSTGVGGPSTAAVLRELAGLGLRTGVLVGAARALPGGPAPGTLLTVGRALGLDGTSRALGAAWSAPSRWLAGPAVVASGDLAWRAPELPAASAAPAPDLPGASAAHPAPVAWDLACAPALALAACCGLGLGAVLLVVEGPDGSALCEEAVDAGLLAAGSRAASLLGLPERAPAGLA